MNATNRLLTMLSCLVLSSGVVGPAVEHSSAAGEPGFPGHSSVQLIEETKSVLIGDLYGDGSNRAVAGRGENGLSLIEITLDGSVSVTRSFPVSGRVESMVELPAGAGEPVPIGLLLSNPDRFTVVRFVGASHAFTEIVSVPLPEDPGGSCIFEAADAGLSVIAVTLPGIDAWLAVTGSGSDWSVGSVQACGDRPIRVVAEDLDDDDVAEVVIADSGSLSNTLSIFAFDTDSGVWSLADQVATPGRPSDLSTCDQDGDTVAEIFVSYLDSSFVSVFAITAGSLAESERVSGLLLGDGVEARQLEAGVTGLWSWESDRGGIEFFRRESGVWGQVATYFAGGEAADASVGDYNGDGLQDIVVANGSSGDVSFLFGESASIFGGYFSVVIGDIAGVGLSYDEDGDGHADLVISSRAAGTVDLARADGTGALGRSAPLFDTDGLPAMVDTLRADGDDLLDLAVLVPFEAMVEVWCREPDGGYTRTDKVPVGWNAKTVDTCDIDGDGIFDLLVANAASDDLHVAWGTGDGTFSEPVVVSMPQDLASAVAIDLNDDGALDLLASTGGYGIFTMENFGDRSFAVPVYHHVAENTRGLVTGDIDGDLDDDVIVSCSGGLELYLLENDASGAFITRETPVVPDQPFGAFAAADFNLDGYLDIAVTALETGGVSLLQGSAVDIFRAAGPFPLGTDATGISVGDFDGDGRPDLAVTDDALGLAVVGLNTESEVTAPPPPATVPAVAEVWLGEPMPNPFNPKVEVAFALEGAGRVEAIVWDLAGRRIATLADRHYDEGDHRLYWDGRAAGRSVAAGVYVVTVEAAGRIASRKMTLVK